MARGFESKDIEFQQAEAERARTHGRALNGVGPAGLKTRATVEEREAQAKRRTVELALTRARADWSASKSPAYRRMLEQAIEALQEQLRMLAIVAVLALVGGLACGTREDLRADKPVAQTTPAELAQGEAARPPLRKVDERPRIVVLGDSLTAGLGLPPEQAYPALLQRRVTEQGLNYEVVNAGVSGDTSAGGLSRLDWALGGDVRVLIVALGGNDGLRGLPAEELKQNLSAVIERAQARHITVVLAGMEAPPNFGRDYIVSFHEVYPALARKYHVAFVPFLLQGVAGRDALNQRDGIHPTAEGARIVADNVWAALKPIVEGQPTRD